MTELTYRFSRRSTATNEPSFQAGIATVDGFVSSGGSNTKYYHADMIGTTRALTAGGSPTGGSVYTAFGELVSGTNHRYGYAGAWQYQAHGEFPFLHVGHRYYDPGSGRFLQRDPIGIASGLNTYAYASGNPLRFVDPEGLINDNSFAPPGRQYPMDPPESTWGDIFEPPTTTQQMEAQRDFYNWSAFGAGAGLGLLGCFMKPAGALTLWAIDVAAGAYALWPL